MWLPEGDVPFFKEHLTAVEPVLRDALGDSNDKIRQNAAYVVERIGPPALSLEPVLIRRIEADPSRFVRMYLYGAVRSIGAKSERTVSTLRARFVALEREPDVRPKENDYTAADERIEVASALLNLDDSPARKNQYLDFVLKWLKPAPQDLTGAKLDDFWEHRWIAVTVVENTGTPREAKSFLEAMLKEPHRRGWVYPKVSRALDALKDADHSTTDKPSKRE